MRPPARPALAAAALLAAALLARTAAAQPPPDRAPPGAAADPGFSYAPAWAGSPAAPRAGQYTTQATLDKLLALRDAVYGRWLAARRAGGVDLTTRPATDGPGFTPGFGWPHALASWACPTNGSDACDPCGPNAWGNWEHVGCLGARRDYLRYATPGVGDVTNFHITDYRIEGPLAPLVDDMCAFPTLRELDVDGGRLEGPIPGARLLECFPELRELDLSYNWLEGEIPKEVGTHPTLREFKVEFNGLTGEIPAELGENKQMRWYKLDHNKLSGALPASLAATAPVLTQLTLDNNALEGNLYALARHSLIKATVHGNAGLCGMVPNGVRFAHGFNFAGTRLGLPCPDEADGLQDL